jgi:phosphatidate cytidylyltransferase
MKKLPDLLKRFVTAIVAFAAFLGLIFWHELGFLALFSLILVVGLHEFYNMIDLAGFKPQRILGYALGLSMFWGNALYTMFEYDKRFLLLPLACMFLILPVELYRKRENPFTNIAHGFLGIVYVAIPFTLLVNITHLNDALGYKPLFLVGFFMMIWASDTGAYFAGSLFGKHKLFERISPKKSWEGAVGGMLLSLVIAAIWAQFLDFIPLHHWLILSVITVVAGIYGDLVESLLKRNTGVKDSGKILPGHGGVLDRFDSIMLATPFAFVYLQLIL